MLPADWETRAIAIRTQGTRGATGIALEIHDLLVAKYAAARDKDREFARAAFRHGLAKPALLLERLRQTEMPGEKRKLAEALVRADS